MQHNYLDRAISLSSQPLRKDLPDAIQKCEEISASSAPQATAPLKRYRDFWFFSKEPAGRSARHYTFIPTKGYRDMPSVVYLFSSAVSRARPQAPKSCARPLILSRYPFPALVSYADRTATPVGLKRDTHISDSSEILDRRARKCIVSIKHQESSWIWSLFVAAP